MSDQGQVTDIRRFNRTVTAQIGALHDRYLARDRSLGASRVLWEIRDGCDVRRLRERLGLDAGYLSRLLRGLEAEGLVRVGPGDHDRRVRVATLTAAGRRERTVLDRRSDDMAASLLAPLTDEQRSRLTGAMREVERLLTASLVQVEEVDVGSTPAQHALREYFAELDERFDGGFDPVAGHADDLDAMRAPRGLFVVASLRREPIGCGALLLDQDVPRIRRMWVSPAVRGLGVGRRLLAELESRAGSRVRLETNRVLTEAIALYRTSGYVEVEPFADEPYAHHFFEKDLR